MPASLNARWASSSRFNTRLQLVESEHEQFCVMLVRQLTTTNITFLENGTMAWEESAYGK
jgi:hypothetical protein